jgi:hypothetical protein
MLLRILDYPCAVLSSGSKNDLSVKFSTITTVELWRVVPFDITSKL